MYNIFTETELHNTCNVETIEEAREIAEQYAVQGHEVEIRDNETGETIALYNIDEE